MPKGNILIVEDEAVVAADLAGKLERAGYRVIGIAADGEDALETAAAETPDLVLMDIRLAGPMDGIETAERMREARSVPVVYLTAHSDANTLQRASMTEPFGYILKPFEERDIATQIEIALYKHEAERYLRQSEERYRTLVETAMDSIITIDRAGTLLSCNAATEHMFGYRREEMLGQHVSMLIPSWMGEEHENRKQGFSETRAKPPTGLWREVKGRRREDNAFPLEVAVSQSFIGDEIRYTGILRDVSERKRAEAELRWRADLLEQTHEAVIVWRMDGGILYWNRGATELYGWTVAEATGRPAHQMLETTLPCPADEFDQRLTEVGHWYGEIQQRTKDGKTVVVESRMVQMSDGQGGVLVMETNRDVTDRHAIHQKICRLAEELEQRVEERTGELVSSQNLLRRLASELTITEQRERRRVATDLHDYLAQLLVCARIKVSQARPRQPESETEVWLSEAEDVLQQALNYTRTLVAQLTPMVLHEFGLPSALKWLAEQMQRHQLQVSVQGAGVESISLPEDQAILLFQSVRELLINVSKHAMVDRATVRIAVEADALHILVEDDGKGMDPTHLIASSDGRGTPAQIAKFGLFSIQERMKALGGSFEMASAPGKGTTAKLMLPLKCTAEFHLLSPESRPETLVSPHPPVSTSEQHSADHPRPRIRILLVDDHAMVRQGLRGILEGDSQMTVIGEASDGLEAVAIAVDLNPEVIIMDINMPKMDGVEATRRIVTRLPSTVVIGLSMHNSDNHRQAMKEAGAFAYLTKESVSERLKETILASRRVDSQGPHQILQDRSPSPDSGTGAPAASALPNQAN